MTSWREWLARELTYIDTGRYLCELPYRMLLMAGMVRLLWPAAPWWALVTAGPVVIVALALIGRWHRHYGWMRQSANVSIREGLSPLAVVQFEWWWRLLQRFGVPTDHVSSEPRAEIIAILDKAARD